LGSGIVHAFQQSEDGIEMASGNGNGSGNENEIERGYQHDWLEASVVNGKELEGKPESVC
jgi:hypothetical protein